MNIFHWINYSTHRQVLLWYLPFRVCKVFGINRKIHCRRELRFPTGRYTEITPTGFLSIFLHQSRQFQIIVDDFVLVRRLSNPNIVGGVTTTILLDAFVVAQFIAPLTFS